MALTPALPSQRPDRPGLTFAAVAFTVLAWASAFVAIRWVGKTFEPGPLALGRLVLGSAALGVFLLARRVWVQPSRREWLLIVVCGVAWFALYNVALNAAEQRVDAGTTAMLVNIGPILIAVFAGLWLGEGFPRWLVIGAVVAFAGVVLIGASTAESGEADLVGVLLCLVAATSYAVGVLTQKPVLRRLPPLQVTWLACTTGAIVCLPYAAGVVDQVGDASVGALSGFVYLGIVPTALAFSTWAYALARMSAGSLGISTYLVPPLTITIAWLLLGEVPEPIALLGGAVCLAGVALTRRRVRSPVVDHAPPHRATTKADTRSR